MRGHKTKFLITVYWESSYIKFTYRGVRNINKNEMKNRRIHHKKKNDERGTRTPGMQGITGLAIPRHTGLGYLVILNFRNASPKMHFIYLTLSGERYGKEINPERITVLL